MMGDLVIAMMRRTGEALLAGRPYTVQDEDRASQAIPPPVLPVLVLHIFPHIDTVVRKP